MTYKTKTTASHRTEVILITPDSDFERAVGESFGASPQIDLRVAFTPLVRFADAARLAGASVAIVDCDVREPQEVAALGQLIAAAGGVPFIVVTPSFDAAAARMLLHLGVADFLVKPVAPLDLARSCARVVATAATAQEANDADIYTFLPAVGGAGVTTLAIQTALILLGSNPKTRAATCLVDLNFQHGSCADYLDIDPRLDLKEVEPRPERLDRQLLEVMLSHHSSGLAVIAAPNRPAEMRTFDPELVTRLLDLVSANFRYVVIDMPRTWFPWTDNVLLGSNKLFIVSEMTVPGVRHAKQLAAAMRDRLGDVAQPKVIINRCENRLFGQGLRKSDVVQALGEDFGFAIVNDYRLVREAIDRGVPLDEIKAGNAITQQLRKSVAPQPDKTAAGAGLFKRLSLSFAR